HIVDRYLETVASLGVVNDGEGLDYFIPPDSELDAPQFLTENLNHLPSKYIAFAIGAAHATKRLPEGKIIEICKGISTPVVLLGGPGDRQTGDRIQTEAGDHVINTCGKLSL